MVLMGIAFLAESYLGRLVENPDQMGSLAAKLLSSGDDAVIFVSEGKNGLDGMIGMVVHEHFVSGERVAGEIFWYVAPTARGSIGIRLLKEAERWAKSRQAVTLQVVAPAGAERVAGVYKALGFSAVETMWQRPLGGS